jgi:RsiW-degrading membrane proteinase PrsW (M82 family)
VGLIAMLAVLSAILPCLLVLRWYVTIDKYAEPPKVLLISFLLGVLAGPIVVVVATILPIYSLATAPEHPIANGLAVAFLAAALPEELVKWLMLRRYCVRHVAFDEPMDGIVYGATVSLGFATIENVGYVVGSEGWFSIAVARAFLAVPSHAASGAIMGYFLARHHFSPTRPQRLLLLSLFVPVLLHGLYDAPLLAADHAYELGLDGTIYERGIALTLAIVLFEVLWARRLAKSLRRQQEWRLLQHGFASEIPAVPVLPAVDARQNDLLRIAWCPDFADPAGSVETESTRQVRDTLRASFDATGAVRAFRTSEFSTVYSYVGVPHAEQLEILLQQKLNLEQMQSHDIRTRIVRPPRLNLTIVFASPTRLPFVEHTHGSSCATCSYGTSSIRARAIGCGRPSPARRRS